MAQKVKNLRCWRPSFYPWVRKIPWSRDWQFTPVFFPGEFHGQRSLAGYHPRGLKESNTTERLNTFTFHYSDTNTRQRRYKKRTQQTEKPHEHNDKNPQHYIIKCSNIEKSNKLQKVKFIPEMEDQFNIE